MLLIADAGATVAAAMPIAIAVTPRGATSFWIFTLTPLLCSRCVQPERYLAASIEKATCRDRTLAILAVLFDRLGRYEPAATIAGFAPSPLTVTAFPEINTAIAHLREVLGDQTYETLARKGETMTTAAMATYAYDQIDHARAELNAVSE